jgi:energy-coupling factor transporter ATP-binding protein EcfA2
MIVSSMCYSQTYPDSIKRNIIEVGMRYQAIKANYDSALVELQQREEEISALKRLINVERREFQTDRDLFNRELGITRTSKNEALRQLSKREKRRFVIGPSVTYGISDFGLGINVGLSLTYKLISF